MLLLAAAINAFLSLQTTHNVYPAKELKKLLQDAFAKSELVP